MITTSPYAALTAARAPQFRVAAAHASHAALAPATRALRLAAKAIVLAPLAPLGISMWLASGMQRNRDNAAHCD